VCALTFLIRLTYGGLRFQIASECASIHLSIKHALHAGSIMKEHWDTAVKHVGSKMAELGKLLADYGTSNTTQVKH
jgi:hypothetical protein